MTTQDSAASTIFSIWPYPSLPACVLRESHGATFVAQAFFSERERPRPREPIGLPDLLTACVIDDQSLLCVSNRGLSTLRGTKLHQYRLVQGGNDRRKISGHSSGLGTAKISKSPITMTVSTSAVGVVNILICTISGELLKYRGR